MVTNAIMRLIRLRDVAPTVKMPCCRSTRPSTFGILVEDIGHRLGQREARDGVGHIGDAVAIDFAHHRFAVGLVGQRQHRGRMGVVDEFVRQESVQQGLDRGIGRALIQAD